MEDRILRYAINACHNKINMLEDRYNNCNIANIKNDIRNLINNETEFYNELKTMRRNNFEFYIITQPDQKVSFANNYKLDIPSEDISLIVGCVLDKNTKEIIQVFYNEESMQDFMNDMY